MAISDSSQLTRLRLIKSNRFLQSLLALLHSRKSWLFIPLKSRPAVPLPASRARKLAYVLVCPTFHLKPGTDVWERVLFSCSIGRKRVYWYSVECWFWNSRIVFRCGRPVPFSSLLFRYIGSFFFFLNRWDWKPETGQVDHERRERTKPSRNFVFAYNLITGEIRYDLTSWKNEWTDGWGGQVFHSAKFNFTLTKFFLKNFLKIIAIRKLTDKNSCPLVVYSATPESNNLATPLSRGREI